jgi:hypothetical protein
MRTLFYFFKNRPKWMNKFQNQLWMILVKRKLLLVMGISFLFVFIFSIITGDKNRAMTDLVSLQNKRSEVILLELQDINSVLHHVEDNPLNSKQQQMALQSLERNIVSTQKAMIDVAKVSDIQKVSGQITSVKDDIDSQMNDIKKAIAENRGSKQFLDTSTLPFHIVSVDVIAGQPYVSVKYASHISPLAIGDLLTGWRVVNADYESGIAEFVNEKNQYVKVSLQGG